ncbi:transposase, partial [Deinococcus malanensis]|uniref:transposase n=1 Tax=Deinococcus malanensis TaxID=1706855 RepID=UPI0016643BC4
MHAPILAQATAKPLAANVYVSGCPPLERFTRTTSRFPARRSGRSRWPGYGFVTAVSVLAETRGFHGLHSSRQLSAYAGIAP